MVAARIVLILVCLAAGVAAQNTTVADTTKPGVDPDLDYDALVKELYGESSAKDTTAVVENLESVNTRRRARRTDLQRGMAPNSMLHGANLVVITSSPYAVAPSLKSWYSYVDMGVTVRLPYRTQVESIPLYFDLAVNTFSFENQFPEGGLFEGLAYSAQMKAEWTRLGILVGLGFWDGALGGKLGADYTFWPFNALFLRVGSQGVLITEVEQLGAIWWLDLGLSIGLEL